VKVASFTAGLELQLASPNALAMSELHYNLMLKIVWGRLILIISAATIGNKEHVRSG